MPKPQRPHMLGHVYENSVGRRKVSLTHREEVYSDFGRVFIDQVVDFPGRIVGTSMKATRHFFIYLFSHILANWYETKQTRKQTEHTIHINRLQEDSNVIQAKTGMGQNSK